MRGKWDTEEPLVHAPNQQRQQQQQSSIEEQRQPLQSATTPAWGIADRIVKEESMEDKNNDSGVSPDHYTSNSASPRSRRSSSTANCSLSPGSATSQDSNNMQCTNFDYSPQRVFKGCGSPTEFTRNRSMEEHQAEQSMDVVSSSMKPSSEDADLGQDTLQCPICAFTTLNRLKFTEHLASHCATKWQTPEFVKTVLNQLSAGDVPEESTGEFPGKGERSEHESEEPDEPGLRVPRVNSQGKVKTFRCKQCNFVAITKLEFWEHSRGHIKAEKLLTCPKCPFVTEYKHHLEYHLRNHFGSKPFKCDKCAYSCVNKSMLNSHLKSHSNIYQYRCANCSYATKYCHSLKLHLRKYSHQPAMVLNADGSPNPLPIIDVYGTRRGPKLKPVKSEEDPGTQQQPEQQQQQSNALTNNNLQSPLTAAQITVAPQVSPLGHRLPVQPFLGLNGLNGANGLSNTVNGVNHTAGGTSNSVNGINSAVNGINNTVNGLNKSVNGNGLSQSPSTMLTFPYNQLFAGFSLAGRFPVPEEPGEKQSEKWKCPGLVDYSRSMDTEMLAEEVPQETMAKCFGLNGVGGLLTGRSSPGFLRMANGSSVVFSTPSPEALEDLPETKNVPLDLSKPDAGGNGQYKTSSPRTTGTSRRKGIAVKLERRVIEEDTDEEQQQQQQTAVEVRQPKPEESFEPPATSSPGSKELKEKTGSTEQSSSASSVGYEFTCQYCEIVFGNVVMYTVHMGYHGYNDPYTCNMCGHQCTDKVSFFLHIARSEHS